MGFVLHNEKEMEMFLICLPSAFSAIFILGYTGIPTEDPISSKKRLRKTVAKNCSKFTGSYCGFSSLRLRLRLGLNSDYFQYTVNARRI